MYLYREIQHEDLVLFIPLSEEETRRLDYLNDTLTDGQWEVRELAHDDAIACAGPGGDQVMFGQYLHDVVVRLFDAIDSIPQPEADEYAAQADQD